MTEALPEDAQKPLIPEPGARPLVSPPVQGTAPAVDDLTQQPSNAESPEHEIAPGTPLHGLTVGWPI